MVWLVQNKITVDINIPKQKAYQRFITRMKQFEERQVTCGIYGSNAKRKYLITLEKRNTKDILM